MNKNLSRIPLLLLALSASPWLFAASPDGKTIAMQGNGKGATACIACHGQHGEGNADAGYPYLAGLPVDYIRNQLTAFGSGSRKNAVMQPIAGSLSQQDIAAVADYFSGLTNDRLEGSTATPSDVSGKGAVLAQNGKWAAGVPACFRCHGADGLGVAPHFPPIVGQPEAYLRNQLVAWQTGARSNDPIGLMQSVVNSLSKDEIDAVARYLAAQSGK
jgi:cytochrome c553